MFSALASFSGALAHAQPGAPAPTPAIAKSVAEAFGPATHEAHASNDPFAIVQKLGAQRPAIYFDCGNSDSLLGANRKFADLLAALKIPYEYREPIGAHNWEYWDRQVQEYLRILAREWRVGAMPPMMRPPSPEAPPPRR